MNNLNDFKTALNSLWTDVVTTRKTFNDSYLPLSAVDRVEFNGDLTVSRKLKIIGAILAGEFTVDYGRYYVHVLPQQTEGYLNASGETTNGFYFDTKSGLGGSQTKFTKEEIEELKKMPSLKGINFDNCLERVEEDEE